MKPHVAHVAHAASPVSLNPARPPEADDGLRGEAAPHLADEGCDGVAAVERVLVLSHTRAAASLGWQRVRGRARAVAEDREAEVVLGRPERPRGAASELRRVGDDRIVDLHLEELVPAVAPAKLAKGVRVGASTIGGRGGGRACGSAAARAREGI